MLSCIITGNTGNIGHDGGGIVNYGTMTLTNCVVSGNTAAQGGGAGLFNTGTMTLIGSTVTKNTAAVAPSGVVNTTNGPADTVGVGLLNLYNSIIALNTPGSDEVTRNSGTANAYNTLSSVADWSNTGGDGVVNYQYDSALPLFTDAENGDYSLPSNSQALNIGNAQYAAEETDLAGNPRIQGVNPDVGAYEYQPASLLSAPTITPTISGTTASVSFSAVSGASGYRLQYGTDSTFAEKNTLAYVSGTVISGLTSGTTYYFRLQAVGDGSSIGSSVWSAVVSASTDSDPVTLDAPVLLAETPLSSSEVFLEWSETEHAAGYLVRYRVNGTDGTFLYVSFAPEAASGSVTSLTSDTVWAFQIKAVGSGRYNDSDWSLAAAAATPAVRSPVAPTITLLGAASVLIPVGYFYIDPGVTASDHYGRPLIGVLSGTVDTTAAGVYLLTWTVTDGDGLSRSAVRTVQVIETTDEESAEAAWGITLGVC